MRPKDEYIAAAFWEEADQLPAWDARGPTPADLSMASIVVNRARELQSAADNPARTKCPKCPNMMVNPRPCGADNCGFGGERE